MVNEAIQASDSVVRTGQSNLLQFWVMESSAKHGISVGSDSESWQLAFIIHHQTS